MLQGSADERRGRLAMVVTAAGRGVRFESQVPKQYVPLLGIPMLQRTLTALSGCREVDALVVVVNEEELDYCQTQVIQERIDKIVAVVPGGEERSFSVRGGLRAVAKAGEWDLVGVHDGARPLVTCGEVARAVDVLWSEPCVDGVVVAVPSADTMKVVDADGFITDTPDRRGLWRAQTPQIFRRQVLMSAYDQPDETLLAATDDSWLVERRGGKVKVVQGSAQNLKITDRADFRYAENVLAERRQ